MHGARGVLLGLRPSDDALYRRVKIPEEVIEHPELEGLDSEYSPEYLVEPELIREPPDVTQK